VDIVESIDGLRARLTECPGTVGFVPTMGFLHDGHVSLMTTARDRHGTVVASIFVNPLQFAPTEDLAAYPRDPEGDRAKAAAAGVDVLFCPTVQEMYPRPMATVVTVDGISLGMEGASRPTHFAGVATVVAKLLSIVGPCTAYFGEKDFQQLAVIRRMAADLSLPAEIVGLPTVREPDGLARSSRNVYLSEDERAVAPVLHDALVAGARLIAGGETDAEVVRAAMRTSIEAEPLAALDYVEVADVGTLEPQEICSPSTSRLFGAVRFRHARLIDNVGASPDRARP